MISLGDALLKLGIDKAGFDAAINEAERNFKSKVEAIGAEARKLAKENEEATKNFEAGWKKMMEPVKYASIAMTAVGVAGLKMVSDARQLNAQLGQTAITVNMTTGEMRDLALATTDVSFPLDSVAKTFEILARAGVKNPEILRANALAFDALADATNSDAEVMAELLIPVYRTFGLELPKTSAEMDKFTWLARNTTVNLSDFATVVQRLAPEMRTANISFDDAVIALAALNEKGIKGRQATQELGDAIKRAAENGTSLAYELRLTTDQVERYRGEMAGAKGITDDMSKAGAEQFGVMDNLRQVWEELGLRIGSVLTPLEPVLAAMTALGPILLFSTTPAVIKLTAALWGQATAAWAALGPLGLVIAAAAGVSVGAVILTKNLGLEADALISMNAEAGYYDDSLNELRATMRKATEDIKQSTDAGGSQKDMLDSVGQAIKNAEEALAKYNTGIAQTNVNLVTTTDTMKTYRDEMYAVTLAQLVGTQTTKDLTSAQIDARAAASSLLSAQIALAQAQGFQAAQGGQAINRGIAGNLPPAGYEAVTRYVATAMGTTAVNVLQQTQTAVNAMMGAAQIAAGVARESAAAVMSRVTPETQALSAAYAAPGYQFGGIVPGPIGRPQLAVVHGGERYLGEGGERTVNIIVQLDGRVIASAIGQPLVDEIRVRTGMKI